MTKYPKGTIIKLISDTRWLVGRLTQDLIPQVRARVSCGITRFIVHMDRDGGLYHTDGHELSEGSEQELLRFKDLVKKGMDLDEIYREYKSSLPDEQAAKVRVAVEEGSSAAAASAAEAVAVFIDDSLANKRQEVLEELPPGEWPEPVVDEPAKIDSSPVEPEAAESKASKPESESRWVEFEKLIGPECEVLSMICLPEGEFKELLANIGRLNDTVEKVATDKSVEVVRALLENGRRLQDVITAALNRIDHLERSTVLTKGDVLTFLCSHEMTASSAGSSLFKFADDFLVWFNSRISK